MTKSRQAAVSIFLSFAIASGPGAEIADAKTAPLAPRAGAYAPRVAVPATVLTAAPSLAAPGLIGALSPALTAATLPQIAPAARAESPRAVLRRVDAASPLIAAHAPLPVSPQLNAARAAPLHKIPAAPHAADKDYKEAPPAALEALQALEASIERRGPAAALGVVFDAGRALRAAAFEDPLPSEASEGARVSHFLKRLGFRDYSAGFAARLENPDLTEGQRKVFALGAARYQVFDAARGIAAAVMEGLERQGHSDAAWAKAAALAASLAELRPLEPPSRLPLPLQKASLREKREWLAELTARRIAYQAERVTADIVDAVYLAAEWDERRNSPILERRRALRDEVRVLRDHAETALISLYTDVEGGGGRFAGRALAAALVRRARQDGVPEREIELERAMEARGFRLSDMVGDSFSLSDRRGRNQDFALKTGDVVGTRGRSRRSSEIAYGARPHWSRWWRGWREGVFGNIVGVFLKPLEKHAVQIPGQSIRNRLRRWIHRLRKAVANTPPFLKSYSHVGIADVREADGVRMAWVWENEVDSGEGGIRLVSFWDQFLVKDYHARFGYSRLDAAKTLAAYKKQAAAGYEAFPSRTTDGSWRSAMTAAEHSRWADTPEEEADAFAAALHRRAATTIEGLMMAFGLGYGWGMADTIYKAVCSATIYLGYKLGAQFEIQTKPDMWHPLTVLFAKLGLPQAASQNLKARVFWPASFFVDEKVGEHFQVDLPGLDGGRIADEWQTIPDTRESDTERMRQTRSLLAGDDAEPFPVRTRLVGEALKRSLVTHRWREGDLYGGRGGLSLTRGWFRGIMRLYR